MDKLPGRLNRVEGQIRGIKNMYADGRDCLDMVQQIIAARQALGTIGKDLLTDEALKCSRLPKKQSDFDKILKNLFDVT